MIKDKNLIKVLSIDKSFDDNVLFHLFRSHLLAPWQLILFIQGPEEKTDRWQRSQRSFEDLEDFVHKITFNFTSMSLSSVRYWDIAVLAEDPPCCQPVALICAIKFALIGAIKAPIAHPTAQSYHRLLLGSFTHFQIDCNTNLSSSEGITTKRSPTKNLQDGVLSARQRLLYSFQ